MVAQTCNRSTLRNQVGGFLEARSLRPAWPTWWNPASIKNAKISQTWWQVVPATQEAEAGESLEPGRQRLQWAEIVPLHSSLGNKSETPSQKKKRNPVGFLCSFLMPLWHRETLFQELLISTSELKEMSEYYFDGKGKAFRPIIVALMARACNIHHNNSRWALFFIPFLFLYLGSLSSQGYLLFHFPFKN